MAKVQKVSNGAPAVTPSPTPNGNGNARGRKRVVRRAAQMTVSSADLKHLPKAPGDYHEVARKFADALEMTKFRGTVTSRQLRVMVGRGQRLAQRAHAAHLKAIAAERRRMVQDSHAWKSMLSSWRLVQAAMPERPDLEASFAFMQDYMSVTRSAPPPSPAG